MNELYIKLSVQNADALRKLQEFVTAADSGLKQVAKSGTVPGLVEGANSWTAALTKNRMALMELGHTARATADIMILGGNPRQLAAQVPQIIQGLTMMGIGMSTLIPIIGGVTLAVFTGYAAWNIYKSIVNEAAEEVALSSKRLSQVESTMSNIQKLRAANLIGAKDMVDMIRRLGPDMPDESGRTYTAGNSAEQAAKIDKELIRKGLMIPGAKDGDPAEISKLGEAMIEINKIKEQAFEGTLPPERQKLDAIAERFDVLIAKAKTFGVALVGAGNMSQGALDDIIKNLKDSRWEAIKSEDQKDFAAKKAREHAEAERAASEGAVMYARQAADARAELERQLTIKVDGENMNRVDATEYEYSERMRLNDSLLYQGIIGENEYTKAVQDAAAKRISALRDVAEAKEQALQQVEAQQRRDAERSITGSDFLTDAQKYDKLTAGGYQDKSTMGANPSSMVEQMSAGIVKLQNDWGTMAQQVAKTFTGTVQSAVGAVSAGISGLILGTKTWGQALREVGATILTTIINAIIQMGVRWIATQLLMAIAGKGIAAAATAANIPIAAAQTAIWSVPATLATIASYGGAAVAAPGFISVAEGLVGALSQIPGRRLGGRVTAGDPFVVGEERPELFVPSQDGYILPYVPSSRPAGDQTADNGGGANLAVHVHQWPDEASMNKFLRDNPRANHIMLDKFGRSSRTYRPK